MGLNLQGQFAFAIKAMHRDGMCNVLMEVSYLQVSFDHPLSILALGG